MENLLPRQKPLKKYLPILGCIVLFALLSLAYFNPVLSGKVLVQGDIQRLPAARRRSSSTAPSTTDKTPTGPTACSAGCPITR